MTGMTEIPDYASEHLKEECGVFGMYSGGSMDGTSAFYALQALQHRGQESAGIAASDGENVCCYKNTGLVAEVFDDDTLEMFSDKHLAIGHVRYSTAGSSTVMNAQPILAFGNVTPIAIAHNGNLLNAATLRHDLQRQGSIFMTESDTEVFLHMLSKNISKGIHEAVRVVMKQVVGSYALVILTKDRVIGIRDPHGMRPLVIGKRGDTYFLASESCAFNVLGAELVRDVKPGEMVILDGGEPKSTVLMPDEKCRTCLFEYVYFARQDSIIDGVEISQARVKAGEALAKSMPVEADIVAGVPDSALDAAMGYARASGIPYGVVFTKNRYIGRTFIQPTQQQRDVGVRLKLSALSSNVKGKRVILIDDSIVRGTTSRKLVEILRAAGATEVHMRISSPPVKNPCYFGIDTPSKEQLMGANHNVEETRKIIGADSLAYLDLTALQQATSPKGGYCTGCFDGIYPYDIEKCAKKGLVFS